MQLVSIMERARGPAKRVLVLSDSLAVILASTKGRSSRRGMCRALRRMAALALTCGFLLAVRWVPSEVNVADKPSRRGLRPFTKDRPHHRAARLPTKPSFEWRPSPQSLPNSCYFLTFI